MLKETILKKFKENLILFVDELIGLLPAEKDLILLRILLDTHEDTDKIIQFIISHVLPLKHLITSRDDAFILKNIDGPATFSGKIEYFKILWRSDTLDDDDKADIWKWIDFFVSLTEKYKAKTDNENVNSV